MIVLVQCTAAKRQLPAHAKDLYDSDLFTAQQRYAEAVGDKWYILSAKHGLLSPTDTIPPYDTELSDVDTEPWAKDVVDSLGEIDETVKFAAGSDYADPLVPLLEAKGVEVHEPFRGKRIGTRINAMQEKAREKENNPLSEYEA